MILCSQAQYDFTNAKFCKEIVAMGSFGLLCNKLACDKAAFLMVSLKIGNNKYIDLRSLLHSDVQLPASNQIATDRSQSCLTTDIFPVNRDHQVGNGVSYNMFLTHTVNRLLTASDIDMANNLKIAENGLEITSGICQV